MNTEMVKVIVGGIVMSVFILAFFTTLFDRSNK
jgi:hypothetical protein